MSILTPPPAIQPSRLWRMTVDQYHALAQSGFLRTKDRVELLEGLVVSKMTIRPPHTYATQTLRDLLAGLLPPGWFINSDQPITTADSEPEPDLTIVRGQRRTFVNEGRHPGPTELSLVVEVAESSLNDDQTTKLRIYARAEIAVYWIVNLIEGRIEVYTDPTGLSADPVYQTRQDFGLEESVPLRIGGREVGHLLVRDILP